MKKKKKIKNQFKNRKGQVALKHLHPKTQKHGNRSNVTSVVMLRVWTVNCRTSNEKKVGGSSLYM
jgi:hypothetical protein